MKSTTSALRNPFQLQLSILVLLFVTALPGVISAQPAEPPPSGTNLIHGTIRFSNADADTLARLGAPGNEGMSSISLQACTDVPEPLQSTKAFFGVDPLSNPFALTVAANDTPLTCTIFAGIALDSDTKEDCDSPQTSAASARYLKQ